jgi:hypothetical protein
MTPPGTATTIFPAFFSFSYFYLLLLSSLFTFFNKNGTPCVCIFSPFPFSRT